MSEKRFSNDLDGASSSKKFKSTKHFNLAIAGCSHGEMDKIYGTLANLERNHNFKFDLLICCGDFQVFYKNLYEFMLYLIKFRPLETKRIWLIYTSRLNIQD